MGSLLANKVQKVLDQLKPRSKALMRYVVQQCAEQGYTDLSGSAMTITSPTISDYKRDIEVRVSSSEENSFAVCLNQKAAKLPMNEPILLFLRSIYKPPALMDSLMSRFEPFTQYTMPFVPDTRVIRVVYRKVNKQDFDRVYQKNLSDWNSITKILKEANIKPKKIGEIPKIDIFEDLADRIAKMEKENPHWKPMTNEFKDGTYLAKVLREEKTSRIMNDVRYQNWKNLGLMNDKFSRQDQEMWEKFQEEIIG